jgi:protein SCO1/2
VGVILGLAGGLLAGRERRGGFVNTDITGASYGRISAHRPHRRGRSLADYRGKVVTLFFGYTQCPDVCPTNLLNMVEVMRSSGRMPTRCRCCS